VVLALGDSKSAPDTQTWADTLAGMLSTATTTPWRAIEMGRGGYTLQKFKDNLDVWFDGQFSTSIIDNVLTSCQTTTIHLEKCQQALGHDQQPTFILLNLGANDVGFGGSFGPWVLPDQTTWQNNYIAVINTLHTQWPAATIGITKPWKRQPGQDETLFDTMAGWIDNVVAARPAFAFVLDDERVWFKPNALTYSNDSTDGSTVVHYNPPAGQQAGAAAKLTALGF
jgi:hypothetical protein